MAKLVEVTYIDESNRTITEICDLLEDADKIVDSNGDIPEDDVIAEAAKDSYVSFEDEHGIFFLHATKIRKITILKERQ